MSNYSNIKELSKQKYSKKQGLGFDEREGFAKGNNKTIKNLTK
jgi:hypothetical protein